MTIFKCYNDEKSSFKYFPLGNIFAPADRGRTFRKLGGFKLPFFIDSQLRSTSN